MRRTSVHSPTSLQRQLTHRSSSIHHCHALNLVRLSCTHLFPNPHARCASISHAPQPLIKAIFDPRLAIFRISVYFGARATSIGIVSSLPLTLRSLYRPAAMHVRSAAYAVKSQIRTWVHHFRWLIDRHTPAAQPVVSSAHTYEGAEPDGQPARTWHSSGPKDFRKELYNSNCQGVLCATCPPIPAEMHYAVPAPSKRSESGRPAYPISHREFTWRAHLFPRNGKPTTSECVLCTHIPGLEPLVPAQPALRATHSCPLRTPRPRRRSKSAIPSDELCA